VVREVGEVLRGERMEICRPLYLSTFRHPLSSEGNIEGETVREGISSER
jgi:hypothetical protein